MLLEKKLPGSDETYFRSLLINVFRGENSHRLSADSMYLNIEHHEGDDRVVPYIYYTHTIQHKHDAGDKKTNVLLCHHANNMCCRQTNMYDAEAT